MLQSQLNSCGGVRAHAPSVTRHNSSRCRSISARPACAAAAASAYITRCCGNSSRSVSSQQQQRVLAVGAAAAAPPRTSTTSRVRVVVCRDGPPRPMWAVKQPPDEGPGGPLAKMITKEISKCDSITALEDVFNEWGGSFDHIHTSAAMVKCAKLSRGRQGGVLFKQLVCVWLQVQLDADVRGCANILWACSRIGSDAGVWNSTWEAYVKLQQQDVSSGTNVRGTAQQISNALLACAKLRKQPAAADMRLLLEMFLQQDVLAAAAPQAVANITWAISELYEQQGWQGGVSEQQLQQLLGEEQLQLLLVQGAPQAQANYSTTAITSSATWLPISTAPDVQQTAKAAVMLQFQDEGFLQRVLQHANQLAVQGRSRRQGAHRTTQHNKEQAGIAAVCSWAVARLDMPPLASAAQQLVANSRPAQTSKHPADLRRLWVFHNWLLQHQLLDGKGLTGLLTEQQLQKGAKEAAGHEDQ